jgi:CheY-like chemotaxis protein
MPVVDGLTLLQQLAQRAKHSAASRVPAILMSGDLTPDLAAAARAAGAYTVVIPMSGEEVPVGGQFITMLLDSLVKVRGGTGAPTGADSAKLRTELQGIVNKMFGDAPQPGGPVSPGQQCHDITVYPALGLAGGACEGHGLLLDISDPLNPRRLDAVADSNFAYWHSATFNNDGTKILFSDEWGGGGSPKCRATDKPEWGSNAIFTIKDRKMQFESYYKIPTVQTANENCVAHNGSLIPIPGRDVMVQAWYQGGISVFDWTDAARPFEIASFDRGPVDSTRMVMGGSWSVYWYNGAIVSSEIARGLDVAEMVPSEFVSQNEIDAAKTVRWSYLNAQGQPKMTWPPTFALARAFADQLERKQCMTPARLASVRSTLSNAERAAGAQRSSILGRLASELEADARGSCDKPKVDMLKKAVTDLQNLIVS